MKFNSNLLNVDALFAINSIKLNNVNAVKEKLCVEIECRLVLKIKV